MSTCPYEIAWVGKCKKPVAEADTFCSKHADERCVSCGRQATHECSYAGQFVCGAPLCDDCIGTQGDSTKGLGWGLIGHNHIPKDQKEKV